MKLVPRTTPSNRWVLLSPLTAMTLTIAIGSAMLAALDQPVLASLYALFIAPVSDSYGLSELALKSTPLLLCAIGLSVCYRAGIWNIGAEGQFVMGALAGGAIALVAPPLGALTLPAMVTTGVVAGMGWAAIAAWLRTRFGASEILTTIMLNYIAVSLLTWAVHGPLRDPGGYRFPESALFETHALLPALTEASRLTASTPFALLAVGALWWFLARTLPGYQIAVLGADSKAASFAGFSTTRLTWLTLLGSGAFAGLAGISEVAGPVGQLTPHVAFGYGYAAIIVAFIGRLHPLGMLLASLLLALTYLGGENLQINTGISKSVTSVFQGLLLFFLLGCDVFIRYRVSGRGNAVTA